MKMIRNPEQEFYQRVLGELNESSIDYLVGGGFAFQQYTGNGRTTKDCDLFVRQEDCERVLNLFATGPYTSHLTFPHWLAKIKREAFTIDVIFNSGNGTGAVDDEWFAHAVNAEVLGIPVKLVPPEEMIQSKAYIMESERYDGADVAHMIAALGESLDWERLMRRMEPHWEVLFSHIVLFSFVYPFERDKIPFWVCQELLGRFSMSMTEISPGERICNGTFLSRKEYLTDTLERGYTDGRLVNPPSMSREDIRRWTEAIDAQPDH